MKLLTVFLMSFFLFSCAHHHKNPEHHHHAYEKQCAYSVSKGDLSVHGSDEYFLDHGGKTYYFSSQKAKDQFSRELEKNINKANTNWIDSRRGR